MNDDRSQRNQYISQNICRHDVILVVASRILYFFVIDNISDHDVHRTFRDRIGFQILFCRTDGAGIQIGSDGMLRSQF